MSVKAGQAQGRHQRGRNAGTECPTGRMPFVWATGATSTVMTTPKATERDPVSPRRKFVDLGVVVPHKSVERGQHGHHNSKIDSFSWERLKMRNGCPTWR